MCAIWTAASQVRETRDESLLEGRLTARTNARFGVRDDLLHVAAFLREFRELAEDCRHLQRAGRKSSASLNSVCARSYEPRSRQTLPSSTVT